MRARRSAGERTRTEIATWMPLDARNVALLGVAAVLAAILASFLH